MNEQPPTPAQNRLPSRVTVIAVPLLFLLFSAPLLLNYIYTHGDERHYVDAAVTMLQTGDYFTPYQGDGEPRFKKPIVTYWFVATAYQAFGISHFSSRFPFWLTGAFLVFLTGKMAWYVFRDRETAFLSMVVLVTNPLFFLSASRSIPDMPLALFLTISAYGFLGILLEDNPPKKFYWMAYCGAALGFATKGLLAMGLAGAGVLYLLLNPWRKKPLKDLLDVPAIATALVLALGWYILMYSIHGDLLLEQFFRDQVSARVTDKHIQFVTNIGQFTLVFLAYFLPWLLPLTVTLRQGLLAKAYRDKTQLHAALFFAMLWLLLTFTMCAFVNKFFDRYFLFVLPLASMVIAHSFSLFPADKQYRFLLLFSLLFAFLSLIGLSLTGYHLANQALSSFQAFVAVTVLLAVLLSIVLLVKKYHPPLTFMLLFLSILPVSYVAVAPVVLPEVGVETRMNLDSLGIKKERIAFYGDFDVASRMRAALGKNSRIQQFHPDEKINAERFDCIIFEDKYEDKLDLDSYTVRKISSFWKKIDPLKLLEGLHTNRVEACKNKSANHYFIAYKTKT